MKFNLLDCLRLFSPNLNLSKLLHNIPTILGFFKHDPITPICSLKALFFPQLRQVNWMKALLTTLIIVAVLI